MSLHAATLPGHPGHAVHCRQAGCPADFGIVHFGVWHKRNWHAAVKAGPQAIAEYLKKRNQFEHSTNCPFRDLPPEVHATCDSPGLEEELRKLREARG
ncbi:hypothetical protein ACFVYG_19705 [Streptomyces sp. NPDC058256]|uniref:hypothetical protein n=1 Tax=Streptomyces sp. NPDC058256 TaxID=3346408 RepID=UPI0036ED21B6